MRAILNNRLRNARAWLGEADPPHRWRLLRADCPSCGGRWFVSLRSDNFMTRCLSCRATGVALSILPVVRRHAAERPVRDVWEMSTYGAVVEALRRSGWRLVESEYLPGHPSGAVVDGVRCEDVQATSFADESLDLVTSNCVFEHVEDDLKGFQECFRILRPGGALVLTVPLRDSPATERIAEVVDGAVVHLNGVPEYHASRTTGPDSVLTFWHHSRNDILERLRSCGFAPSLEAVRIVPSRPFATEVVYARKPGG